MKKVLRSLAVAVIATSVLASCSATMPLAISSNPIGSKVGKQSGMVILNAIYFGADWSIRSAAKNGGITKVATVDVHKTDILGILQTYETIVTGE